MVTGTSDLTLPPEAVASMETFAPGSISVRTEPPDEHTHAAARIAGREPHGDAAAGAAGLDASAGAANIHAAAARRRAELAADIVQW